MPKFGPKTSADLLLLLDFESARGQELQQNVSSDTTVDAVFCTLVDILDEDVEGALWIKSNQTSWASFPIAGSLNVDYAVRKVPLSSLKIVFCSKTWFYRGCFCRFAVPLYCYEPKKHPGGEKSRWIQAWITHYSPTLLNFRASNERHQQIFNTFATNSVCNDSLRTQNRYAVCFVLWKGEWFLRHQHQEAHQQLQALSVSIPWSSNPRWVVRLEWGAGLARLLTFPTWCIWCCKACSNIRQGLFFPMVIDHQLKWRNMRTWHHATLWLFWNCSFQIWVISLHGRNRQGNPLLLNQPFLWTAGGVLYPSQRWVFWG